MPAGIQAYAPDGTLLVSITDKIGKVLGYVDTGTSSGSLTNPALARAGAFFLISSATFSPRTSSTKTKVTLNKSTGVLSWVVSSYSPIPARIIYGYMA